MSANVETMAYVMRSEADIPWHKLGTPVPEGASSAEEIIAAAGLDWQVNLEPVYLASGAEVDGQRAIVRDRDQRVFGMVTDSYHPIQNSEAFDAVSEWLQDGRLQFETAGALGDGSKVWGLARVGEDFRIADGDSIRPYVMLYARHDGHGGVSLKNVSTRIVCANTLAVAMNEGSTSVNIWHTAGGVDRIRDGSHGLGIITRNAAATAERFRQLADMPASDDQLERIASIVAPLPANDVTDAQRERAQRRRLAFLDLYQNSPTVDRGTRWGLFNAATEYIDHVERRPGHNAGGKNENWLESRAAYSLTGWGANVRQQAFDALQRMKPVTA